VRELAAYLPAAPLPAEAALPMAMAPAPAPRPRDEAPSQPWPDWEGIDVALAMSRCRREKVLRNGLANFARQYTGQGAALRGMLAPEHREELTRTAHTLKGLGAQLGMTAVAGAAVALEDALRGRAAVADGGLPALVETLAIALETVLRSLAIEPPLPASAPDAPGATVPPRAEWGALRRLLADADSEALVHWHAHRTGLMAALPPPQAVALDDAVQRCDFEAALALLPAEAAAAEAVA
jgi:HPt (histidine-containing phosphotransfer) domain-containing protein